MKLKKIFIQSNTIVLGMFYAFIIGQAQAAVKIASQAEIATNPLPDPSAMLEVSADNMGILIPRMTQEQRDAIENPAQGLMIFNTVSNCINTYTINGPQEWWYDYCVGNRIMVDASIRDVDEDGNTTNWLSHDPLPQVDQNGDGEITWMEDIPVPLPESDYENNLPYYQDNQNAPWVIPYTAVPGNDSKDVNYSVDGTPEGRVWDNGNWVFKAPFTGLYSVEASFGNRFCGPYETVWKYNWFLPNPTESKELQARRGADFAQTISVTRPMPETDYEGRPSDERRIDWEFTRYSGEVRWPRLGNNYYSRPVWERNSLAMRGCSVPNVVQSVDSVFMEAGERIAILGRYRTAPFDVSIWNYYNDYINRLVITFVGFDPSLAN